MNAWPLGLFVLRIHISHEFRYFMLESSMCCLQTWLNPLPQRSLFGWRVTCCKLRIRSPDAEKPKVDCDLPRHDRPLICRLCTTSKISGTKDQAAPAFKLKHLWLMRDQTFFFTFYSFVRSAPSFQWPSGAWHALSVTRSNYWR